MSDNTIPDMSKRYWHGTAGDRYEHPNLWINGGAMGPATRAAWALTPEMMAADAQRRNSYAAAHPNTNTNTTDSSSPTTPSVHDRRRSSVSIAPGLGLFSGLSSQKRETEDANMTARRASWTEQREQAGFFSKLWEGYTQGSQSSSK